MNTAEESVKDLAYAYYEAIANKDISTVTKLLHPEATLTGPLGNAAGKEAVLAAVSRFANSLKNLRVKALFASENQAMVNYDVDFGEPLGICRSAALLSFRDDTIVAFELFFDPRPFEES